MRPLFQSAHYTITCQVFALLGKLRICTPEGETALYAEEQISGARADWRLFADERKTSALLLLKPRQERQFSECYDILDAPNNQMLGSWGRCAVRSLAGDEWLLLANTGERLASCLEARAGAATLLRPLLGNLIPRQYHLQTEQTQAASLKQHFNLLRCEMSLQINPANPLDPRLILGFSALLAILEVWQDCGCRASPSSLAILA